MRLSAPVELVVVGWLDSAVSHRRYVSFNAGVFKSAIRSTVPSPSGDSRTLMLVGRPEAITEPGCTADLLDDFVNSTVECDAFGVYVTHFADELSPLPLEVRIGSILVEGLIDELELHVDCRPRFGAVGKSMPEFIALRLVANARDRVERADFEALAAVMDKEAVQKTLSDAESVD